MDDEKFRQELDELFRLFNKLMAKSDMDNIPGVNKLMLQQFQMFFTNYETMKDDIAQQLQGQFGESVKDMVHQLVQQLKNELGDDDALFENSAIIDGHVTPEEKPETSKTLEEIDALLKNPNLTDEEIDELLDRRMKLANG